MTLIVSDILALKLIKRTVQEYTAEGATFNIMALDKIMKEMVEDCKTHEDMCFYAADNGINHQIYPDNKQGPPHTKLDKG